MSGKFIHKSLILLCISVQVVHAQQPEEMQSMLLDSVAVTEHRRSLQLKQEDGTLVKGLKRHPDIGNHVVIYSGATILGGETIIGDNVTIGGNTFIVTSVPADMRVSARAPELEYSHGPVEHPEDYSDWVI